MKPDPVELAKLLEKMIATGSVSGKFFIDADQGTVMSADGARIVTPRRRSRFPNFTMVFHEIEDMTAPETLGGTASRVLWRLVRTLDWDNYKRLSQAQLARDLHVDRSQIWRALEELMEAGLLHKGPKVGQNFTYRLDPRLVWRGDHDDWEQEVKQVRNRKEPTWHKAAAAR